MGWGIILTTLKSLPPTRTAHLLGMHWLWLPFLITRLPPRTLALPGDHSYTALPPVVNEYSTSWDLSGAEALVGRMGLEGTAGATVWICPRAIHLTMRKVLGKVMTWLGSCSFVLVLKQGFKHPRLAINSWSSCGHLLSAGITGLRHHNQLKFMFKIPLFAVQNTHQGIQSWSREVP